MQISRILIRPPTSARARRAYTLIELMIVVVTIGLLSGVAVASLKAPYQQARLEDSCQRVLALDAQVRARCQRRATSAEITWDITRGRVEVEGHGAGGRRTSKERQWPQLQLPTGLNIQEVSLPQERTTSRSNVKVPVDTRGRSPSYVLAIGRVGEEPRWFFVVGRTGQTIQLESQREVRSIIRTIRESGPDAR